MVDIQRSQREMLLQEVSALERMRNINNPNGHPTNEREELQVENQFVKAEIERLTKEKKNLEGEERILKKILNVEEEHKRHGVIITAGIRKMFSIKVKEQKYKEATAQEYSKNLAGLSDILSQRKAEYKTHLAEYEEKKSQLAELREENALKNKEYSEL